MVTAVMVKLSHGIMYPWERPMVGVRVATFSLQSIASPGAEICQCGYIHLQGTLLGTIVQLFIKADV